MRIILVTAPSAGKAPFDPNFLLEKAFRELLLQQTAHEWLVAPVLPATGGWSFFNTRKALASIRKLAPDLVLYASGNNPAFATDLPSVILIADKSAIEGNKGLLKKLSAAKAVITPSAVLADRIINTARITRDRVHVIPLAGETTVIDPDEYGRVREQFTGGKEYLLYTGPIARNNNWERLLQAFSLFKKWQQSGMQLVLSGNIEANFKTDFDQQLNAYKHRQDIIIAGDMTHEQKDQLAAAAFIIISPCKKFEDRQHIIDAFRNGVPVITEKNELAIELAADAALYASLNEAAPLSQQMINLYKDERLYNDLIQKGKSIAGRFNWHEMVDELSRTLLSVAEG